MITCIDKQMEAPPRVPSSTYRLQMFQEFTFDDAAKITGYLNRLGIGDVYVSPIFEARPGSTHGYDITRHDRLNPELGGEVAFERFSAALKQNALGLILDIVPNHMGIGNNSHWWQDVLENGRASVFSEFFDIDWEPLNPHMKNKLLLPILGAQYGEELEKKRIQLILEDGRIRVAYYDNHIPLSARTVPMAFTQADRGSLPQPLKGILEEIETIPVHASIDPTLIAERQQRLIDLGPKLVEALRSPEVKEPVLAALEKINGVEGDPDSFDRLHALLEAQAYRIAYWRVSSEEINYRRFFDINDLAGLRMEHPLVFKATHCLIRQLLAEGKINGLRIDHCDGLFNPRQYTIRLQLLALAALCAGAHPSASTSPSGIEEEIREHLRGYDWVPVHGPLYVVVEKILEPHEYLPREWPVFGTSGYEFVHLSTQLFIQSANQKKFDELYAKLLDARPNPEEIIYRSKLMVMQSSLSSEVHVLTNLLSRLASADRYARDFTDNILEAVIRETIACFPVYRTYIDDRGQYTEKDRAYIRVAVAKAKRLNPGIDASAFDFLAKTLLLGRSPSSAFEGRGLASREEVYPEQLYFALKFQQLTGPVMAKGVEDTSFYTYNRFLPTNEVGSSIQVFGIGIDTFHEANRERLENAPDSMLTTSTHDTKRSEDVRHRLNVLSEMPIQWASLVRRWQRMNASHKRKLDDGRLAPDNNEEYQLYQSIVGAWPWDDAPGESRADFIQRMKGFASKALSEAKVNLSWINPNPEYERAVHGFLEDILTPIKGKETGFVRALESCMPQLRVFGAVNSLSQLVLKLTSPGVPDFYQGQEMWDLSMVDPDNRRPVDYGLRDWLMCELEARAQKGDYASMCQELLANLHDGRTKLWTTHCGLKARHQYPLLFRRGSYAPLTASSKTDHVVSFLRREPDSQRAMIVAVPRFACTLMRNNAEIPLGRAWQDSALNIPPTLAGTYRNLFTGELHSITDSLRLADLFKTFPVAILVSEQQK